MFNLLDKDSVKPSNSEQESGNNPDLEMIDGLLKDFYKTYGHNKNGQRIVHAGNYERLHHNITDKLGSSAMVVDAIEARKQSIQSEIDQLEEQLTIQNEAIQESNKLLKDGVVEYTKAVVAGSDDLIGQLEANQEQLEKNIKQANNRKSILQKQLEPLGSKLRRTKVMAYKVAFIIREKEYREATDKYRAKLKDFAESFNEFCKASFHAPGGYTKREIAEDVMKELNGTGWARI